MFEKKVIYMYIAPGHGQTTPLGSNCFINSIIQSIKSFAAGFAPLNDFVTVFPNQTYERPNWTCRKIGQGQPMVIIYINFVELESPMLHAKFQDHRTSGSGEEDF